MTEERFELTETLDIKDNLTAVIYPVDLIRNHPKQICALLNELYTEKNTIKQNIDNAYHTERTAIGKSVLKQLINNIDG